MMLLFAPKILTSFLFFLSDFSSLATGKFGISYLELLLMFEIFTGHRLLTEKNCPPPAATKWTPGFSGFSICAGKEIRHDCQFLRSLLRDLGHLPGVLLGFFLVHPGAHFALLSHDMDMVFPPVHVRVVITRFSLLFQIFFRYPDGTATELFNGTLPLPFPVNFLLGRFLIVQVACRWLVPVLEQVFIFQIMILF